VKNVWDQKRAIDKERAVRGSWWMQLVDFFLGELDVSVWEDDEEVVWVYRRAATAISAATIPLLTRCAVVGSQLRRVPLPRPPY